jgi:hypothetical protein
VVLSLIAYPGDGVVGSINLPSPTELTRLVYINLPVGAIAIAAVFFFFKNPERKESKLSLSEKIAQIDLLGAFFLIAAIVCLLLALQWGGITYSWKDSQVWGCILGFVLLICTFTGIQFWKGDKATLPPRIMLKQRTVFTCAFFSAFLAMALYVHIYYLPFYVCPFPLLPPRH